MTVYDLHYFFNGPDDPDNPRQSDMRSVLVQSGSNQFHEVYVDENLGGTMVPTQIVRVGTDSILKIRYNDGGIYRDFNETYLFISPTGVALLDFAPVFEAASRVVPSDRVTYHPMSQIDFSTSTYRVWTEPGKISVGPKVACCQGRAEVPFRIENGRVMPGRPKYFPDARPY